MNQLVILGLPGLALVLGLALIKASEQKRLRRHLRAFQLSFPRSLEADGVTAALSGIAGLLLPWWRRWLATPFVSLETHASSAGISHFLVVPEAWSQTAMNLLEASVPSVRFEQVEVPAIDARTAAEYRLTSQDRTLTVDAATLSTRLIANLHPLTPDETIVVQWLITPHGPVAPIKAPKPSGSGHQLLLSAQDSESVAALRKKVAQPLLLASGRIGVRASTGWRELKHLRQVEAAWHETRAPGVHFRRRLFFSRSVASSMQLRRTPFADWPARLTAEELSGLVAWPIDALAMPGLDLGGSRQLAPSPSIPTSGTVLADSTYPGVERPLAVDLEARLRHLHCIGPTGTGKSNLLAGISISDLAAGLGLIVLDPKVDLLQAILERVPEHRRADVIVFDPADTNCPVGLNPLRAAAGISGEVVVENLVGSIKSIYRQSWGPRLDDILRAALLTLARVDGATLCEVPLILSDSNYRRRIVGRLDDPVGLEGFWGWYEGLSDAERQTVVGPVLNKVRAFTMRPTIRSIIGQSTPRLQLSDVMASGKVLLCSLATGLLGEEAAALLGSLLVAEIWHATTARAGLPQSQRPPVMCILDEFQNFVALPTPMASMLAEARGLGLGMTLAHQHLGQLGEDVKAAALANCRSRVAFQLPAADARVMSREMGGLLSADDLQGLGQYEVACQLFAAGSTHAPATGKTRPLPPATSNPERLRSASRAQYGTALEAVEQAIRRRQSGKTTGAIGRRPRTGEAA
jgi:hypothetical protein